MDHLLRGETSIIISASSDVEGYLLDTDKFSLATISVFLNFFASINQQEIFMAKQNSKFKDLSLEKFKIYINKQKSVKKEILIFSSEKTIIN